ncbi:MAG: DUF305 domain-containing protein [bacterium]|nr:DUF305 domain-containing protein [bacterium]
MHDHSQGSHGVMNHASMESSLGAADAPHALQFLDTMIAHHERAIDMALLANTRSQRNEIKTLTQVIIDEQRREIAEMRSWRTKWFGEAKSAVNVEFPGMKTGTTGMDTVKLARLKANEFDVEFIKQMIPHHEGAIEMAKALRSDDRYPELQKLADSLIISQSAEIEQMRGWLAVWSVTAK